MREDEQLDESVEETTAESGSEVENEELLSSATVEELEARLNEAEAKADENWQRVLRMQADLDNQRKRAERDVENAHKFGLEKFAEALLPVLDSLEMGITAAQADGESGKILEGTELTHKMLVEVVGKFGVEAVESLGQSFDPELHQAISMQPSEEHAPNTVINVMQKGYLLNSRLLRPAMVIISKS